ncbi:MAG: HD domain-containing protein, partial [Proteobacteria bacterium]|nr:HD domain-containing protein [Pseudomonadota bacterium]
MPEVVSAGGDPAVGQLESLVRLAAGYQFREDGVVEHLRRVCAYVGALAAACNWPARETLLLRHAALFHDVGMTDVPESILRKEGKLTDVETAMVKRHPELGRALLGDVDTPLLREAAALAWTHHEAFDGSGYPRGIRGDAIPAGARILAVADVFDALTTRRAFKDAYPIDVAVEIISKGSGHRFDPEVVTAFLERRA